MERYTLTVAGMSCDGCEATVEGAVGDVEGVHRVDADHDADSVTVAAAADTTETVRAAIEAAGYEVRE